MHGGGVAIIREHSTEEDAASEVFWNAYFTDNNEKMVSPISVSHAEREFRVNFRENKFVDNLNNALRAPNVNGLKAYDRIGLRSEAGEWDSDQLSHIANLLPKGTVNRDSRAAIPAAYTYFGQFIAHEVTNLAEANLDLGLAVIPTPAFDLDSFFVKSEPNNHSGHIWVAGVGVGLTSVNSDQSYDDLPRNSSGIPYIADSRNDQNLGIAQTQVALSKFHQLVLHRFADGDVDEAQRITTRHIQSVVLHDYLKRLVEPGIWNDIIKNGRKVVCPGQLEKRFAFAIPLEFAAACFRVGHSMVRGEYKRWHLEQNAALLGSHILNYTHVDGGLSSKGAIERSWKINWDSMIDKLGTGPNDINPASDPGPCLASTLRELKRSLFSSSALGVNRNAYIDIADVTLGRTEFYQLSSAQCLIHHINAKVGNSILGVLKPEELLEDHIFRGSQNDELRNAIVEYEFDKHTPLWLYCLFEASADNGHFGFGQLAGRIVMETLHAAIEASDNGIIEKGKEVNFGSEECICGSDYFRLQDVVLAARTWDEQHS